MNLERTIKALQVLDSPDELISINIFRQGLKDEGIKVGSFKASRMLKQFRREGLAYSEVKGKNTLWKILYRESCSNVRADRKTSPTWRCFWHHRWHAGSRAPTFA